jgi:hypothetical protein
LSSVLLELKEEPVPPQAVSMTLVSTIVNKGTVVNDADKIRNFVILKT